MAFKKGISGNPGGTNREQKAKFDSFRSMVFEFCNDKTKFNEWAECHRSEAYKLAASLMPKPVELSNDESGKLVVEWIK